MPSSKSHSTSGEPCHDDRGGRIVLAGTTLSGPMMTASPRTALGRTADWMPTLHLHKMEIASHLNTRLVAYLQPTATGRKVRMPSWME